MPQDQGWLARYFGGAVQDQRHPTSRYGEDRPSDGRVAKYYSKNKSEGVTFACELPPGSKLAAQAMLMTASVQGLTKHEMLEQQAYLNGETRGSIECGASSGEAARRDVRQVSPQTYRREVEVAEYSRPAVTQQYASTGSEVSVDAHGRRFVRRGTPATENVNTVLRSPSLRQSSHRVRMRRTDSERAVSYRHDDANATVFVSAPKGSQEAAFYEQFERMSREPMHNHLQGRVVTEIREIE